MVDVAAYSGLRISELVGLRWNDVGHDCLMVDERVLPRRLVGSQKRGQ